MAIILDPNIGITNVNGTAAAPALTGNDTNTGIFFPAADTIAFAEGGVEAMRLDASGNVGIGTASPSYKLDISGSGATNLMRIASTNLYTGLLMNAATGYGGLVSFQTNGVETARITGDSSSFLSFSTGASTTERMRIDSSGNVLVGNTSFSTIAPLTVAKTPINVNYGQICAYGAVAGDVASAGMSVTKYDNNTTTSQILFKFLINQGANGSGQINSNGANACAFGTYSDARIKENIEPLSSQLDNILALKPSEFDYIESEGGGHQIGFIAQEMQEVYPDAVGERSDGMLTISGWDKTTARLVKAIQEQQTIINDLKARVEALEAK